MVVRGRARRQARRRQAHGANACDDLRPTWKILISKWINSEPVKAGLKRERLIATLPVDSSR
jgi:hypothetical protein